ncbi:negative regulator of flagellin synthesis FlgM [Silvibacterium bohemicum]|uniref:Negative regulator of flagellin synthesis n=1 Tax=Silvibacterium bohemicum TaxID=1577686 RepID=A0A841K2K6_9BACT|nr:flagellar biosynthesis anti-sigma factor FlgM [Silvibacterium bohemicum]MBB6147245.1 negative regulator of flagellin synthesis FlgM [Silvibacterium bohemicum]
MNISGGIERAPQTLEAFQTVPAASTTETASTAARTTASQPAAAESAIDQAHLSAAANIMSQAAGQTDVRMDKVASVQAALASGSYQVSSAQVAGKLIDQMLGEGK